MRSICGRDLPRSNGNKVDNGLGKEPAMGTVECLQPTDLINTRHKRLSLMALTSFSNTQAPKRRRNRTFYLPPAHKAFGGVGPSTAAAA
jgi:alkyl sulfatase BDS1-like metallo-beta-lactamase superfamily hydrolase